MKISKEMREELRVIINDFVEDKGITCVTSHYLAVNQITTIRDLGMRMRWDIFWAAKRLYPILVEEWVARVYALGANDTHIDTVLKAINKELQPRIFAEVKLIETTS